MLTYTRRMSLLCSRCACAVGWAPAHRAEWGPTGGRAPTLRRFSIRGRKPHFLNRLQNDRGFDVDRPDSERRGPALFDLTDRVAVVIGGTSGIGRALAHGLADAGAHVVASGRRGERVEAVAAEIEGRGRRSLRQTVDVGDPASVEALRDAVLDAFGQVDVLVNCAGVTLRVPTLEGDEDGWRQVLDTNLDGTWRACRAFGKPMVDRGQGRIVNIGSLASSVGLFEVAAYTASKAGVAGLTRALAVEWGRHGVRVNAIAPGVFRTDLNRELLDGTDRGREFLLRTPLGRFGKAEELVGAAIFLASDAASFVNGVVLPVDGGFLASGVNQ